MEDPLGRPEPKKESTEPVKPPPPEVAEDAGSQALSEALRSSFVIVKIIMVLLVIVFFGSGVFTVPSQERAIVLRFGRPVGTGEDRLLEPGLHWSFPYPIDEVVRIPSGEIQTVRSTVGWYATTPEMEAAGTEPPAGPSLNPAFDGYALTADTNIIHARATVSYRIRDPLAYELGFVNASNLVQNAVNNALIEAATHFTVDQVLREELLAFQERVLAGVRQAVDEQGLGVSVDQAVVRAIAPRQVQPAFQQVLDAEVDRSKAINDAQAYANRIVSTARGEANRIVNSGETERIRQLQGIASEAEYFTNQLPYFKSRPQLFMARAQLDTVRRAMTNAEAKFVIPRRTDGKAREIRILLNRKPKAGSIGPAAP